MKSFTVQFLLFFTCVVSALGLAELDDDLDMDEDMDMMAPPPRRGGRGRPQRNGPPPPPPPPMLLNPSTAAASLDFGGNGVYGGVSFVSYQGDILIVGTIANLTDGQHGIHIHESGNVWGDCKNIGGLYNPFNKTHTCDPSTGRLGDLGNINAANGVANVNIKVSGMTLNWSDGRAGNGNSGVLGLSIAVDANPDNCQAANDGGSAPVIACGMIFPLFNPPPPPPPGQQ